ncbi:MAG: cysteine desulfurase [Phycisphaeraceae bacterium]|nr:cysteine desulfurase [Phycisphaeraceae bacterium]
MIDLDANATTRPTPAVVEAVVRALTDCCHNPSATHRAGMNARAQIELARRDLARLLNARPIEITFTSGGTEAICHAIRGVLAGSARRAVVSTPIEHSAIRLLLRHLADAGEIDLRLAPVTRDGVVDPGGFADLLDEHTALACCQLVNNETGVIQPVGEIAVACARHSTRLLCDATQAIAKIDVDVRTLGCDLLTLAAHKFHGPKGAGALWTAPGLRLPPLFFGSQEMGRRAGTENVSGILGMAAAAREAAAFLADHAARSAWSARRDRLEHALLRAIPGASVNGRAPRVPNTTNIAFPGIELEVALMSLSERGVLASGGSACSSGSLEASPVLRAMGLPEALASASIRFSLSRFTTDDEIDRAIPIIVECLGRVGSAES